MANQFHFMFAQIAVVTSKSTFCEGDDELPSQKNSLLEVKMSIPGNAYRLLNFPSLCTFLIKMLMRLVLYAVYKSPRNRR